jgi:hypothetical protein
MLRARLGGYPNQGTGTIGPYPELRTVSIVTIQQAHYSCVSVPLGRNFMGGITLLEFVEPS